jgi:hypothetical protein
MADPAFCAQLNRLQQQRIDEAARYGREVAAPAQDYEDRLKLEVEDAIARREEAISDAQSKSAAVIAIDQGIVLMDEGMSKQLNRIWAAQRGWEFLQLVRSGTTAQVDDAREALSRASVPPGDPASTEPDEGEETTLVARYAGPEALNAGRWDLKKMPYPKEGRTGTAKFDLGQLESLVSDAAAGLQDVERMLPLLEADLDSLTHNQRYCFGVREGMLKHRAQTAKEAAEAYADADRAEADRMASEANLDRARAKREEVEQAMNEMAKSIEEAGNDIRKAGCS